MMEFFNSISSFFDSFVTYTKQLFETVTDAVTRFTEYVQWLPTSLITVAGIIIVLLVVFRILGR